MLHTFILNMEYCSEKIACDKIKKIMWKFAMSFKYSLKRQLPNFFKKSTPAYMQIFKDNI